jgi:hypothetical protein
MSIVFTSIPKYGSYTTKYSWQHWNLSSDPYSFNPNSKRDEAALTNLVKGNMYVLMNQLLGMVHGPKGVHPWVTKRKLR